MSATSRELIRQTLDFENPARAPRQLWYLPWAEAHYPEELERIKEDYPPDLWGAPAYLRLEPRRVGDMHKIGTYIDEWGVVFVNVQNGVHGEVKDPIVQDWDVDREKIRIPREWLSADFERVNRFCGETDRWVNGGVCPRPFEQMQFLRGTENLLMDLLAEPPGMMAFLRELHGFYCELLEAWGKSDVDGLNFMDDWGSQQGLLINPEVWRAIFKPLYRDYVQIAHAAGKKSFMHSDGHILAIYPDLVEIGVDALNSQIFCMGVDELAPFAGKITFWGEMDRQYLLVYETPEGIDRVVRHMHQALWRNGGCIAQCEFGPGAKPENVRQVFASWDAVTRKD